ncbi:TPA: transketolase family protein [Candidatus Poribacteria bacterium]|nr:transketolase family protein [Candidatus Poribacteria bacterium]
MINKIDDLQVDKREMRNAYIDKLIKLSETDERIIVLDADLMHSNNTYKFKDRFPNRAINVGIQEANMIGVAAGLSLVGKIPFAHTFTCFAARRDLDQLYLSVAYAELNVKLIATDPGIAATYNGGSHMSFEDIGIMRTIPSMTVIEPTDSVMMESLVEQIAYTYGPFYVRLFRKNPIKIYDSGDNFKIGQGIILREGEDVTIIASGIMVAEALKAADLLEKGGISARVVDMFTIKPIDKDLIIKCAEETKAIVTAENSNTINGLGSAVAEVLVENKPVPMERIGIQDLFGEVGDMGYLKKRYHLTADDIVNSVIKVVNRKR